METVQIWFWVHDKKMDSLKYKHNQWIPKKDLWTVAKEIVDQGFNVMISNGNVLYVDTKNFNQR